MTKSPEEPASATTAQNSKGWWAPCDECGTTVIVDGGGRHVPGVDEWTSLSRCPVCGSTLYYDQMTETCWEREGRLVRAAVNRGSDDMALALLAVIEKVHAPIPAVHYAGQRQTKAHVCAGCGTDDGNWQQWPCPTLRAINKVFES